MKGLSVSIAAFILVFGTVASRAATVDRISAETGVPVATLQAERASTGLGWGALEKANLIANGSGQSFDMIVGKFHSGEGWGKIAHDFGLNLGQLVSAAHRSSHATMHAHNTHMMHGKNTNMIHGKSMNMGSSMTTMHGVGFGSHGAMPSMSHMSGGHR
ncbi:MAG TPA: hypothetical protein VFU08_08860 [Candidatus Udaeobacter sp.]|nr:hypothetical protein [Candidatus Udaeobacter sp.]